jgi:hypothetical protein
VVNFTGLLRKNVADGQPAGCAEVKLSAHPRMPECGFQSRIASKGQARTPDGLDIISQMRRRNALQKPKKWLNGGKNPPTMTELACRVR